MGMYNLVVNIASFFNTYAIPTVWEKIHWRFLFVYIAWDVFEVIYIYLLYVPHPSPPCSSSVLRDCVLKDIL